MSIPGPGRVEPIHGRRLVAWALVAVVGIDLLFFTGASNFGASAQARVLNHLIYALMAVVVFAGAWLGRIDVRTTMLIAIGAWSAALAIATAGSERLPTSIEALALVLVTVPGYVLVRAITWTPWLRPRLDRLLVGATIVFLVAYLVQAGLQWATWWSVAGPSIPPLRPGDVGLTVGTVNAVALYIELLVPLAAWLAWAELRRPRLAWAIGGLGLVALFVTGSRGAWLGAAGAAVAVGLLAWVRAGRPVPTIRRAGGRVGTVVLAIVGLLGAALVVPVLLGRLLDGDAGRIELWTAAWSMFTSDPLTGTGPGTFPMLRPLTPISSAGYAVLATSHNSILQVLTDGGVVLLAAAAVVIAVVGRLVARGYLGLTRGSERMPVLAVTASLLAALLHSIVDVQFQIVAVVVMVFLLIARLDPPGEPSGDARRARGPVAVGIGLVLIGLAILGPVDVAMVRAQLGNTALDRGDPATAARDFQAAVALHELAPYRLGEGIAASRLGDAEGAFLALERAADIQALTFLQVAAAGHGPPDQRARLLDAADAAGFYDAGAALNTAHLRFAEDPALALPGLTAAMGAVPTLIISTRPEGAFDDVTWERARADAFRGIATDDPVLAAVLAAVAGWEDELGASRARVTDPPVVEALDLLVAATSGATTDVDGAIALLRRAPASRPLQLVLWQLGFVARSQAILDAVQAASIPLYYDVPVSPMEVVVDGRVDADWTWVVPRWPMASDNRNAPDRPYPAWMLTIEPVLRPE